MDPAEEHDRFIAAQNGGAVQNGKKASNNEKSNGFPSNECDQMYKSVAVCVEPPKVQPSTPCRLKRCLVISIIVIVAIIVLAAAAFLVLYLCMPGQKKYNFRRPSNSSNSTNATQFGVKQAAGIPFWTPCDGVKSVATVHHVFTKDCVMTDDYPERCQVYKGADGIMQVVFTPSRDLEQLKITSCGTAVFGICTEQVMNQPDACRDSNLQCPLRAGQTYMYSTTESVRISFPGLSINVDTRVTLHDASNDDVVFCVIIPIRVHL